MHHHGNSSLSSLGLSAGHTQELQSYLRFFRNKREVGIRQIEVEFEDILDRQLSLDKDSMYTYEEVSDAIHGVKKLIKEHVRQDISNIINMNVLLLKQILNEVEEKNVQYRKIYGVDGERNSGKTGVWLDVESPFPRKICAMGVRASRWVTMHGFALNVDVNLDYFNNIIPCGLANNIVTSLNKELGDDHIDINKVKDDLKTSFSTSFKSEFI